MKPFSPHWADVAALKVVKEQGDKDNYVIASGITPSGKIHVGNFREVITVDLVGRALRSIGKKVRFIYSWDNFDTFRKVPKNLPDPEKFVRFLGQPIARIPDPWEKASSYAQGQIEVFEEELTHAGIHPEFIYQEKRYGGCLYAKQIKEALDGRDKIAAILNAHRSEPLPTEWLPTAIYCSRCSKDKMDFEKYDGEWSYSYRCSSCQLEETIDIRSTSNLKLNWRTDWPMRWAYENVDFEPGGKDHSSQGGSFDTAKDIVTQVWNRKPPSYLQYDFVQIKGGAGKMSSSSGELYTLSQVLEIYGPQIVRWIFTNQRPNHDFAIAFDEDVIKIHDEFDRAEELALSKTPDNDNKYAFIRRAYELSCLDENLPNTAPKRVPFRELCNRLQICGQNPERTFERYYSKELTSQTEKQQFFERATCVCNWLEKYAPENFRYRLFDKPQSPTLTNEQHKACELLREIITNNDLETLTPSQINELIWEKVINHLGIDSKLVFSAVYQKLIGREQGPRLPNFLKEIGAKKLLQLI